MTENRMVVARDSGEKELCSECRVSIYEDETIKMDSGDGNTTM